MFPRNCRTRKQPQTPVHGLCDFIFVVFLFLFAVLLPVVVAVSEEHLASEFILNPIVTGNISLAQLLFCRRRRRHGRSSRIGSRNICWRRRSVESVFVECGDECLRRAFRMQRASFWELHRILKPGIDRLSDDGACPQRAPGGGRVTSCMRLAMAVRHFAGGQACNTMLVFGVSHSEFFESAWIVVDAVNECNELSIDFPSDHEVQQQTADEFFAKSDVGFHKCCGAVHCMQIWINKPSQLH